MLKKPGQYGGEKFIVELEREENRQKDKSSFIHSVSSNYQCLMELSSSKTIERVK